MKKLYYLSTCNTCQRILEDLALPEDVVLQDIKSEPISEKQLEEMQDLAGSYDALFSKRARLYKSLDLKRKILTEKDLKSYILEHYTFLKRPVLIYEDTIFIGNSKKVVEAAKVAIHAK